MFSRAQKAWLTVFFSCFVIFLYGPVLSIILLAFQGPEGGLTFPMRGFSLHWFEELWRGLGVVDISRGLRRSLFLGVLVMIFTVILSPVPVLLSGKSFGLGVLFYLTIASLIIPSIAISLGSLYSFVCLTRP